MRSDTKPFKSLLPFLDKIINPVRDVYEQLDDEFRIEKEKRSHEIGSKWESESSEDFNECFMSDANLKRSKIEKSSQNYAKNKTVREKRNGILKNIFIRSQMSDTQAKTINNKNCQQQKSQYIENKKNGLLGISQKSQTYRADDKNNSQNLSSSFRNQNLSQQKKGMIKNNFNNTVRVEKFSAELKQSNQKKKSILNSNMNIFKNNNNLWAEKTKHTFNDKTNENS